MPRSHYGQVQAQLRPGRLPERRSVRIAPREPRDEFFGCPCGVHAVQVSEALRQRKLPRSREGRGVRDPDQLE
jgi:hypothetical protein